MRASSPRPLGRPLWMIAALLGLWAGAAAAAFTTFETGQVRPLATLRPRGIGCQVIWLDPAVFLTEKPGRLDLYNDVG